MGKTKPQGYDHEPTLQEHDRHGVYWRACPQCRSDADRCGEVIVRDGFSVTTQQWGRMQSSREEHKRLAAVPTKAELRRAHLEKVAHPGVDAVRNLDAYSFAVLTATPAGQGGSTVSRPIPQNTRQIDPATGQVRPVDPVVVKALAARAELAQLDRDEKAKELARTRVDMRTAPKAVAVAHVVAKYGIQRTTAEHLFQETPAEAVAKEKSAAREVHVKQRISEKYPVAERPAAWQRVLAQRVGEKIKAAEAAGRRPHASDFPDPAEYAIFRDFLRARIAARERGSAPGTPTPSGTDGPTPIPRQGEKPAGY